MLLVHRLHAFTPGLKGLALGLVAGVVVADIGRWLAQLYMSPFDGAVDDAARYVFRFVPWIYVAALGYAAYRAVVGLASGPARPIYGWLTLLAATGQVAGLIWTPRPIGSSIHQAMYPPFVGGLLMGLLATLAARPFLDRRLARALCAGALLLWTAGHLLVDLLALTEGTARGLGPLWQSGIASLLTGTGALIVYVGLPELIWYGGREGLATLAMLGPCLALGWLRAARGRLREHRLAFFALVLCSLVLSARVGGWALFILD